MKVLNDAHISRRALLKSALAAPCLAACGLDLSFAEDVVPGVVEPTAEEAEEAIRIMNATSAFDVTPERLHACETLQRSADLLTAQNFYDYLDSTPEEAAEQEEQRAILRYHNASFDKVLKEVKKTRVPKGSVAFWQLYNMGYVIKTPTQTFGVDLCHRRAPELASIIDFLLVTHKHSDHYTDAFCNAVEELGKPVVSNFWENEWKTPEEGRDYEFGDIKIKTKLVDHNATTLIKFVTAYEIDCGPKAANCVVYHVGDACNVEQIQTETPIDVFIPHLAVGLDVPKAVNETLCPKCTLLSHIMELRHQIDKWRWSYEYGYDVVKKCENDSVVLPMWGEKYVFTR